MIPVSKKTKTLLGMISLACTVALSAAAADLPTDGKVTLKDCIGYALENHNSVRAAKRDLDSSKAGVSVARSGYLPQITANSDYSNKSLSDSAGFTRSGTDTDSDIYSTIGVQATLWDGGRTMTAVKQASTSERMSDADLEITRQQRVLQVTQAYFDVLRTKRLADIAAQTVTESEQQRELIQARIDAGDAAKVDVYPVEVQLANAKLERLRSDNDLRVAMNTLKNEMGLEKGRDLQLEDVGEPSIEIQPLDECLKCAQSDRPEIVRASAQTDSAKAGLTMAKLQSLPMPTAGVSYERGMGDTDLDTGWRVGVGVSFKLFSGGATSGEIKSARARVDSSSLRADQVNKDITTEVEEAYLNLTNALERYSAGQLNVKLAQTNLEVAREKYQQGLAIPLEIVSAQVSHADAQSAQAQALYDCYVARAQLDKAIGKRGY